MKPIWNSLRGRLILLVGLGLLPTLGLLLFASLRARQSVSAEVEAEALSLRQLVAIGQENLVDGVRLVLATLAETPEVRAAGPGCDQLLADVMAQAPSYADLLVLDAAGRVVCGAHRPGQALAPVGRPWFDQPLATGQFTLGEYEVSAVTGEPVLCFGYPLLDEQGQVAGVVAAEVPLARLAEVAAAIEAPEDAAILTLDRRGTVLTRNPDAEGMVGDQVGDVPLLQTVLSGETATRELPGLDGVQRLYAFRPLGREGELGLYLAVGLSRQKALAAFDAQIIRYGSVIVALTLLALGLAYVTGIQLVLRPVEALARGFRRLRQGDLAARVHMGDARTDLGALGQDFNATAEALQAREAERRAAEARLLQSEQRYRTLFTHGGMCAAVFDDDGQFLEVNAACADMLGYPLEAIVGLSLWDVTPTTDRAAGQAAWRTWIGTGERSGAYTFLRRDGGLAQVDYHAAANVMPGHHLWMMRDVTERKRAELSNQVLADAGQALEASLDPSARLRGVLAAIVPALADWCAAHLVGPDGQAVIEDAAHADPARLPSLQTALQQHPLGADDAAEPAQVLRTGKLGYYPTLDPSAAAWAPVGELEAGGLICIPLVARGRTLGVLTLARARGARQFVWADVALALEVGRRAALAVDNARLFDDAQALNIQLEQRVAERTWQLRQSLEEVQASREALRQLSRRLQSARETERRHIAREIHDELGGALTGLKMDAVALRNGLAPEQGALSAKAGAMTTLIDTTIQTVRRLATELRPSLLDDLGLVAALEWLANDFGTRTGLKVAFAANLEQADLDAEQAIALYRTAQESLTNVARHAGATRVDLRLTHDGQALLLAVADDGRGITPDEVGRPGSLGLVGMRERMAGVGGELTIDGAPGRGTRISARLPLAAPEP
jgi:PAS domain S-box-containing protein